MTILKYGIGDLVSHFGISRALAFAFLSVVADGGFWYISVVWPYLIPLVGTAKGLIAMLGFSAAIGW